MNEALSSHSTPPSATDRSVGAKAKQLSSTAAERTRELRKAAARQRLLRQKLKELEDAERGLASGNQRRSPSASGEDLLASFSDANWDEIKAQLEQMHEDAEHYVREHPTKSVLAAVGVGFVLGILMKR